MSLLSRKPLFLTITAATAILFLSLLDTVVSAKPKRLIAGCTTAQIQSTSCDIGAKPVCKDGHCYTNMLYCDSGGHTLCCVVNENSQIQNNSCHVLTLTQRPPKEGVKRPGGFEQTTTVNPNGRVTNPASLLEPGVGTPGGTGPSPTGSPPARTGAPSFQ